MVAPNLSFGECCNTSTPVLIFRRFFQNGKLTSFLKFDKTSFNSCATGGSNINHALWHGTPSLSVLKMLSRFNGIMYAHKCQPVEAKCVSKEGEIEDEKAEEEEMDEGHDANFK